MIDRSFKRDYAEYELQKYLKELAIELMKKAPEGTDYKKHVWVGDVFFEFLQEYKDCSSSYEHIHKKVYNLLNG
jgi:hypothetical protein